MKRHGKLFQAIVDPSNIHLAYQRARKNKSRQRAVLRVESALEASLETLRLALIQKTFTTSSYREKTIYEPKQRVIYRLPFYPDRIVQHSLMNILEPIWSGMFINDSYACRQGKGIHAGSRRTMEFVRSYRYCLKCDISKFYPSVDHDILARIIRKKIKCRDTLWLLDDIIYSYPGGRNVPIGNYTSQWFGNLYLNELDQLLKHQHHVRAYIRYCDDFLLFDNDKGRLNNLSHVIEDFVGLRLRLRLSKCRLFPVKSGVDFLGYRHFPTHILLRKSTVRRVKRHLAQLPGRLYSGRITSDQFRSSIASTLGWMRWANTHNLRNALNIDALLELCRDGTAPEEVQ